MGTGGGEEQLAEPGLGCGRGGEKGCEPGKCPAVVITGLALCRALERRPTGGPGAPCANPACARGGERLCSQLPPCPSDSQGGAPAGVTPAA